MRFTEAFGLQMSQAEVDFVDIDLDSDTPLYLDPYALTTRDDYWSEYCHGLVLSFFDAVLAAVRSDDNALGAKLMGHLGEPEETMLGVSRQGNKGRGVGELQAAELFTALKNSTAARTGLLEDLSDFALFVPGIGRDKISDITTNIIRKPLIDYTAAQCRLLEIPMRRVASGFYWDDESRAWRQEYVELPVHAGKKILLVPKYTVRYEVGVDAARYRSRFVLEYLRAEHLNADTSLVTTIRNKKGIVTRKVVYKKDVDRETPSDKNFLAEFSKAHPRVIDEYRESLKLASSKIPKLSSIAVERGLARHLQARLRNTPSGIAGATAYHRLMTSIISFLFFPNLIYPNKEVEINEGRKRVDIIYTNGKESGFFHRISLDSDVKANVIHVECKNYTNDIANNEFDQLIGRFNPSRGKLGMLMFRSADNPDLVLARARDAARDQQGVVLPIDDDFVLQALEAIAAGQRNEIDAAVDNLYRRVIT